MKNKSKYLLEHKIDYIIGFTFDNKIAKFFVPQYLVLI